MKTNPSIRKEDFQPPAPIIKPNYRLTNDELAKAINTTMKTLNEHHIKYNPEILKATEKHYIALIAEEVRRANIE